MNFFFYLIFVFSLVFLILLFAIYLIYSGTYGVPFYPSLSFKLEDSIKKFGIETKGLNFIDLGSGDGRILYRASKFNMNLTGIEINPFLTLISRLILKFLGVKNVKILNKSFYKVDLSNFDIVFTYLLPNHMDKIKIKLIKELRVGSYIISNTFKFKDLEPIDSNGNFRLYKITKEIKEKFNVL